MKFKATISFRGLKVLEKGFLPTHEKFGKVCQVLLSSEDMHLVQDVHDSDGMQIITRLANDVVYEPDSCVCTSRHQNLIAFTFELALLVKVLKSAQAHDADVLDMRLALRNMPTFTAPGGTAQGTNSKRPVLAFSWRGNNITITQDMPISKPFTDAAVDELQRICTMPALCPFYLDIRNEVQRLQAVVDKLKSLSANVTLFTTKQGELHLKVSSGGIALGEGITGLDVRPSTAAETANDLTSNSTEGRLREAEALGDAVSACMQIKHLSKVLHSCLLTAPELLLCGIAENGGYVHLVFGFRNPEDEGTYDDKLSLSYKLPVLEDDLI